MVKIVSRKFSFIICLLVYSITLAGIILFVRSFEFKMNDICLMFTADILATVLIFIFSNIFRNSSLYDPYWSVAPPIIAWYWLMNGNTTTEGVLMLIAILIWSVRLTFNWCRGWRGLQHEDWRYVMLREKNPRLYQLINLTGIHIFPTVMVFLGMIPVYFMMSVLNHHGNIRFLFLTGFGITLSAIIIEMIADEQMHRFKKNSLKGSHIDTGLWKYSRHPNYFGEISFWFGIWVMQMIVAPEHWWTCIGWIAMTCMFIFASIPIMEAKNLKNKPGYALYMIKVSKLIPLPPRN